MTKSVQHKVHRPRTSTKERMKGRSTEPSSRAKKRFGTLPDVTVSVDLLAGVQSSITNIFPRSACRKGSVTSANTGLLLAYVTPQQHASTGRFRPPSRETGSRSVTSCTATRMAPTDPPLGAVVEIPAGRGTVRFCGATSFSQGKWIGIELEEPIGKNDGSVQGVRYFTCKMPYGVFVRPSQVKGVLALPEPTPPPVSVAMGMFRSR